MNFHQLINWLTNNKGSDKHAPRILMLVAFFIFMVMGIMALMFYKERMLNFDPVYFTFLMLQEEWFSPVLGRYGTILSQLLPLAAMQFGASLESIIKLYSLSFVVLYAIYVVIIGIGFKDKEGVVALCIALTLTFRETFYFSTTELYQAIALSVVLWSLFKHTLDLDGFKQKIALSITLFLIVGISFFHPVALFPVIFVLLTEYLRRNLWKNPLANATILFTVVWFIFKIKFLTSSSYEQERLLTLDTFIRNLNKITELGSYKHFITYYHSHLSVALVTSIIGMIFLLIKRKWLLAVFIPCFVLAFWLLIIIGMNRHESPIMYQNYYTVFGLFVGVLVAITFQKSNVWFVSIMLFGLSMYSLKEIYQSRYDYQNRTELMSLLAEYGQQFPEGKYVIDPQNLPWEFLWMSWTIPFETLIHSEIDNKQQSVSFYPTYRPDTLKANDIIRPESFLGANFHMHWYNTGTLNPKYFDLKEGPYRIVTTLQSEELFTYSFLNQDALKITPEQMVLTKKAGKTSTKITIDNQTLSLIGCIPGEKGITTYHTILSANGDTLSHNTRVMYLDVPSKGKMTQIITYKHPSGAGNRMDIGFYLKKNNSYHAKTSIILNGH